MGWRCKPRLSSMWDFSWQDCGRLNRKGALARISQSVKNVVRDQYWAHCRLASENKQLTPFCRLPLSLCQAANVNMSLSVLCLPAAGTASISLLCTLHFDSVAGHRMMNTVNTRSEKGSFSCLGRGRVELGSIKRLHLNSCRDHNISCALQQGIFKSSHPIICTFTSFLHFDDL